jgi:hypothetical protein
MKSFMVFAVAFFVLGCVAPSTVAAQARKDATTANQCIPRDGTGKPCVPAKKPAATHHTQRRRSAPAETTAAIPAAPKAESPSETDKLLIQLNVTTVANQQRETDAFMLAQQALSLQAETDAKRIAIEQQDADTRTNLAVLEGRRVTYEELNAAAYRKYLPKFASAASRNATANLISAFTGPMGEIGSAFLLGPTQINASSSSSAVGQGGSSSASAVAP